MFAAVAAVLDIFLVISNLVFFIPAIRAVKWYRWTRAPIYFLIVFASGSYHTCRSYSNLCIFPYQLHYNLDFFFAELIIPLSALYLIYFPTFYQWVERWLIILFAILIFVLQIYTNGAIMVQLIIVAISFAFVSIYWIRYYAQHGRLPRYDWIMLSRGITVTMLSVALFTVQGRYVEGYWGGHSVWHVLGALGQDYILRARPPASPFASVDSRMGAAPRSGTIIGDAFFRPIPRI